MTYFLFKSHRGDEKFINVSNYGKFICNIFGWDRVKIRVIRFKVQFSEWILNKSLVKDFIYIRRGRKWLLVKFNQALSNSIKNFYGFVFVSFYV